MLAFAWIKRAAALVTFVMSASVQAVTQQEMFARPGVIGDSLAQGFYGVTVEKKTQDWAYPVLVSKQAGTSLSYNVLNGPYINAEDVFKLQCGPFCIIRSVIGGNTSTVALPTNTAVTGATYTSVLYTTGTCQDVRLRKMGLSVRWYYVFPIFEWVEMPDCQSPSKFHQLGLRDAGTQIEIMQKIRPTFVFATAAANHVLCTALQLNTTCQDMARFKRDFSETMRRLAAIGSVKGGVLFTIPDITSIAYLERYNDPQGRDAYTGLKAFYRSSVSSPYQILDRYEIGRTAEFLRVMNDDIKAQGAAMGFAVADIKVVFDDIRENGRPITGPNGYAPGLARANWPLPNQPGVFGLDGVHPNMLGHAVFSNELIKSINAKYAYNIPKVSEYSAWYYDSLNRNPVNTKDFLGNNLFGQIISWVISVVG